TPTTAFAADEDCTWTIHADGVSDNDPPADNLAADHIVVFHTRDPANTPPTVESIVPANGAVNVPVAAVIEVTFSEAVSTAAGAFALSCDGSGVAIDESGSGAQRTLTPQALLPQAATCTFTIEADAVTNAWDVPLADDISTAFTTSKGLGDYYELVNPSSPEQLRCSLHQTIRGHTVYPYSGAGTNTWTILEI